MPENNQNKPAAKNKALPYDERQRQVRARCFMHAFFLMPVLLFLNIVLSDSSVPWFAPSFSWLVSFVFAGCVAMVEAIWRDAWVPPGVGSQTVSCLLYTVLLLAAAGAQLFAAMRDQTRYGMLLVENGVLSDRLLGMFLFGLPALVPLSYLVRLVWRRLRRNAEEP